jgi:hypothetical protein
MDGVLNFRVDARRVAFHPIDRAVYGIGYSRGDQSRFWPYLWGQHLCPAADECSHCIEWDRFKTAFPRHSLTARDITPLVPDRVLDPARQASQTLYHPSLCQKIKSS